jgi:hypothetical protein
MPTETEASGSHLPAAARSAWCIEVRSRGSAGGRHSLDGSDRLARRRSTRRRR